MECESSLGYMKLCLKSPKHKKKQNKNNPKGMLSGHFSESRFPQEEGTRSQAVCQSRKPPARDHDTQMALPRPAGDYSKTGFSLPSIAAS